MISKTVEKVKVDPPKPTQKPIGMPLAMVNDAFKPRPVTGDLGPKSVPMPPTKLELRTPRVQPVAPKPLANGKIAASDIFGSRPAPSSSSLFKTR